MANDTIKTPYRSRIGEKHNKLLIIDYKFENKSGYYLCECDCGNKKWIACPSVIKSLTKSCGCILKKNMPCENLVGRKYGRLTVLKKGEKKGKRITWLCLCECGNKRIVTGENLKKGNTKSCGCYSLQRIKETNTTHGESKTRLFKILQKMKERCLNENSKHYIDYGGRGISICKEWLNKESGYLNFKTWALQNGYKKNLSIDRINNDGNYEPKNCRWVSSKIQANNRRSNRFVEYKGQRKTVAEWAEIAGISYNALYYLISKNKPLDKVLK